MTATSNQPNAWFTRHHNYQDNIDNLSLASVSVRLIALYLTSHFD